MYTNRITLDVDSAKLDANFGLDPPSLQQHVHTHAVPTLTITVNVTHIFGLNITTYDPCIRTYHGFEVGALEVCLLVA